MRKPTDLMKFNFQWSQFNKVFNPVKSNFFLPSASPDPSKINTARAVYFVSDLKILVEGFLARNSLKDLQEQVLNINSQFNEYWTSFIQQRFSNKKLWGDKDARKQTRSSILSNAAIAYGKLIKILEDALLEIFNQQQISINIETTQANQNFITEMLDDILTQYDSLKEEDLKKAHVTLPDKITGFAKKLEEFINACIPKNKIKENQLQINSDYSNLKTYIAQLFSSKEFSFAEMAKDTQSKNITSPETYLSMIGFNLNLEESLPYLIHLSKYSKKHWSTVLSEKFSILSQATPVTFKFVMDRNLFFSFFRTPTSTDFIISLGTENRKKVLNEFIYQESLQNLNTVEAFPVQPISTGNAIVDVNRFASYEKKFNNTKNNTTATYSSYLPLAIDERGNSLLHYTVLFGSNEVTEYLLKNHNDLVASQNFNCVRAIDLAIHLAVHTQDRTMLKLLLENRDDVNEHEPLYKYDSLNTQWPEKIKFDINTGKYVVKSPIEILITNPSADNLDLLKFILANTKINQTTLTALQTLAAEQKNSAAMDLLKPASEALEIKIPGLH